MSDARHQRIDITIGTVEALHLTTDPLYRKALLGPGKVEETVSEQSRVAFAQYFTKIRYLTHLPE